MTDLVAELSEEERIRREIELAMVSPDDGKYGPVIMPLRDYLSPKAEWKACAHVQYVLIETRMEFGQAKQKHVDEVNEALSKISPLNIALLEDLLKHDQLAVLEEIGRFVSLMTKALLHPGTTSYDILDTARSYLFKKAWNVVMRPKICEGIEKLCVIAEKSRDTLQAGRTHLQMTSPITFGSFAGIYAARLAERLSRCDLYFNDLRGKVSGIVGTGAGIEAVIGKGEALAFEKRVLEKLDLKPDYTSTQIVQKERLADVGHGLTTMIHVLANLANDIRRLYSTEIGEVTSRDNAERLGGSSADATKNNPINYENIAGTEPLVEGGMRSLYFMIQSDHQRDLRSSKVARYQPQAMMAETYEAFTRLSKVLDQLSINEDRIAKNLKYVREKPSEALVSILRGEQWTHPVYGVGHSFVKEMGKKSLTEGRSLIEVCLDDTEFREFYRTIGEINKLIIHGEMEHYLGDIQKRIDINLARTREAIKS